MAFIKQLVCRGHITDLEASYKLLETACSKGSLGKCAMAKVVHRASKPQERSKLPVCAEIVGHADSEFCVLSYRQPIED